MTNPHKGDVSFEAGGKTYTLRFSHLALVKLEQKLDKGLVSVMGEIDEWRSDPKKIRLGTVAILLWAGLQKHHPSMTVDEATELLDDMPEGINTAIDLVGQGFDKAFNKAPGTKGTDPQPREGNGTGTQSMSSSPLSEHTTQTGSGTSLLAN